MTRSGYVDDCEYLELYRGSVMRAIRGKRGQAFLNELAESMDAMDEKILITEDLIDSEGNCCAIGVVCKSRNLDVTNVDCYDPETVGNLMGIARSMAAEIEFMNDERGYVETPPQRWQRIRQWVDKNIIKHRKT